jgi:hypothetical protein
MGAMLPTISANKIDLREAPEKLDQNKLRDSESRLAYGKWNA